MIIWDRKHIEKLMVICYQHLSLNNDIHGVKKCILYLKQQCDGSAGRVAHFYI